MNIEQERKAFESNHNSIGLAFGTEINFSEQLEAYFFVDSFDTHDTEMVESLVTVNDRWFGWLSCAKAKQAEIDALNAKLAEIEKPKVCVWENNSYALVTACGNSEINFDKYCPYCGGKVEVR